MRIPTKISICFCVLTALLAPAYYVATGLLSMGGPVDNIIMLYIIVPLVLLHGLLVAPYGLRGALKSAIIYFGMIAVCCGSLSYSMSISTSFSNWQIGRPIEVLAWSVPWFAFALSFTVPFAMWKNRKRTAPPEGHKPLAWGRGGFC